MTSRPILPALAIATTLAFACAPDDGLVGASCTTAAECDDGDACTVDGCEANRCAHAPVDVDDHDDCTVDTCNPTLGPVHEAERAVFAESFSGAAAGWTLGPQWQVGPATAGAAGNLGGDPAEDHTATGDSGVAGVVIGGDPETTAGSMSYLESPAVVVDLPHGAFLELRLWRWLNSDYEPYARNVIDVFDGSSWVNLWSSGEGPGVVDAPPQGSGWFPMSLDLTPFAGATVKVRFGFMLASVGVERAGGWNVDDVSIVVTPVRPDGDQCTVASCTPATGATTTPYPVDDEDVCTVDVCDGTRGVRHEPITCEDSEACTDNLCDPATGCFFPPRSCDDDDSCTVDACDPAVGCTHAPIDCGDGDPCTADSCEGTVCVHTPGQVHDKCTEGPPLTPGCGGFPCITDVCAADPYCCETAWDGQCVGEVFSICKNKACAASQGSCGHTPCAEGEALLTGCDAAFGDCVAQVCAAAAYCCTTGWDAPCVGQVGSVCAMECD
jgi:hypothetical protein